QAFDPEQLQRVEIVKGPQSALYGRNTYAGAINFVTKDPTTTWTANIRASVAEYGEYVASGSISGPILGEALTFRAGGRYSEYGGQFTNQLTGKKVGQEQTKVGYLTVVARPTEDIKIRLRGEYSEQEDGPLALFLQGSAENNCSPGLRSNLYRTVGGAFGSNVPATLGNTPGAQNPNQYYCGPIQPQPNGIRLNTDPVPTTFGVRDGTAFDGVQNKQFNASAIIDWDLGGSGWILSSMTGYRKLLNRFGTDSDHSDGFFFFQPAFLGVPGPLVEPTFANTTKKNIKDFSQEVRLASPVDKPFRAMVGLYYYKQDFDQVDLTFTNPFAGDPLGSNLSQTATIENKAVFGLLAWDPLPGLTIQGELRYQEETKTLLDRQSATSIFCAGESANAALFGFTGTCLAEGKWTGTDPRITINYTTPGGTLLYAVYARGRKPGGFNGVNGQTDGRPFYSEELAEGGEVGVKWTSSDRKASITVAGFYNKLKGVQLTNAIPAGQAVNSIVVNTGDARNQGFEIEFAAAPHPDLMANVNLSYVDAKFTSGCDADFFQLNSGGIRANFQSANPPAAALPLCDITGKRLPLGSSYQVNGSISWEPNITETIKLTTNLNFSLEDKKYVQTDNLAFVPSAFLLNARIGFRTANGIQVVAFGRNLTNEDAVPLATRWFDYRYGFGTRNIPTGLTFNGQPAQAESGAPRGFFAPLRRGRTFGIETIMRF
uniref:TonB-dependent receptor n=1 Tax=Polymorphobacter sp. TaxID=1909290 RepID=UPI003F715010